MMRVTTDSHESGCKPAGT